MNKFADLYLQLSTGSDSQIDKSVCEKLKILSEQEDVKATEIKSILDEIVYASLASDFVVLVLDTVYNELLKEEMKSD